MQTRFQQLETPVVKKVADWIAESSGCVTEMEGLYFS
jgi:hypothetical protein